jgi:putative transposase
VAFIDEHADRRSADGRRFGVEPICRVLSEHGVPIAPATYYAHRSRPPSARAVRDEAVLVQVRRVHQTRRIGRGLYGAEKVWRQLQRDAAAGVAEVVALGPVARCTVERLMRDNAMRGSSWRRPVRTTTADPSADRPADLVHRNFSAPGPNLLWLVNFTYVPTWAGMAFTAFVSDAYSRRIVGWRTAAHMRTDLPLDALEMALWVRDREGHCDDDGRLVGLVHHSDAGSQYTAIRYHDRLADAGALASIGTVGESYDNARAESVIGLYKRECVLLDGPFRTVDDFELGTLSWVHWFNHDRLHGSLGHVPPVEFEETHYRQISICTQDQPSEPSLY